MPSHGVRPLEEVLHEVLPYEGHIFEPFDVGFGQVGALDHGPGPRLCVIIGGTYDEGLALHVPVGNRGASHGNHGNHHVGAGEGLFDRLDVLEGQGLLPLPDGPHFLSSPNHQERVRSEDGHHVHRLLEGSFGGGNDDGDGGNAQGHAHQAEERPQPESRYGPKRLAKDLNQPVHGFR